jgi:hypothetical protein
MQSIADTLAPERITFEEAQEIKNLKKTIAELLGQIPTRHAKKSLNSFGKRLTHLDSIFQTVDNLANSTVENLISKTSFTYARKVYSHYRELQEKLTNS